MPSPVGHSFIGFIIFHRFKNKNVQWNVYLIFLVMFVSNLPDLDFLPGILQGEPNRYHHGISHSFGFVIFLSILIYIFYWLRKDTQAKTVTSWFIVLCSLHVFLDFFAVDTTIPFGQPIFWPFWDSYFLSPFTIFFDIQRANDVGQFLPSLFSVHNLQAILIETVVGVFIWILIAGLLRWGVIKWKGKNLETD